MTKPDWGFRREVQAFDKWGGAIVGAVRGLRYARREGDTWCGSSIGRRPHRAGWRRLRREPSRRTAAPSSGRGRLGVLARQAPASAVAVGAQAQAAVSGGPGDDEGWRGTAPELCRRRRSSRCLAPSPPRRPSRLVVARSWETQQHRNFFLDFDDRFGALQPLFQAKIVSSRKCKFRRQRIWFGGFGAALGGAQRFERAGGALTPPVRQRRRVKSLAAHDRADRSRDARGAVGLSKDTQLVLRRECPGAGAGGKVQARQQPALKRSSASGLPPYQRWLLQGSCCL